MTGTEKEPGLDCDQNSALAIFSWTGPPPQERRPTGGGEYAIVDGGGGGGCAIVDGGEGGACDRNTPPDLRPTGTGPIQPWPAHY